MNDNGLAEAADQAQIMDTRWQCPLGHFVAEDSIRCFDHMDPGAYYGVSTTTEFSCRPCGRIYEELPRIVTLGRSLRLPEGGET